MRDACGGWQQQMMLVTKGPDFKEDKKNKSWSTARDEGEESELG
jgi:hypothetical protein